MPKARYEEIYKNLKEKIENGSYSYGELLPSENQLILVYNCSRNTIRRALARLITDGYVQAIHGKGVQVIFRPIQRAAFMVGGIESFTETAQRNRFHVVTKVVQFEEKTVDTPMAHKTGFPDGAEVYLVQRIRYLDGKALIRDINIFLQSQVPGLTKHIAEGSIYDYIENKLGMQIITSKRMITVEHATAQDEQLLDLGDYNCLAVVSSQTFNSDGVMFEYTQSRHQPDYFGFHDVATRKKPTF